MLKKLQNKLQYEFEDVELLEQALTHRSYLNEHADYKIGHNERLEFLGDAILDFIVSDMLYERFPDMPEGRMTRLRAAMVRTESLADLARQFELGNLLKMARGEEESGGRTRKSNLCNAFEAVMGAIYVDTGIDAVWDVSEPLFETMLDKVLQAANDKDAKSRLQEWSQSEHGITPTYKIISAVGEDHAKTFTVQVYLENRTVGQGVGKNKQAAEQAAARQALGELNEQD